jgi:hypothetical protein
VREREKDFSEKRKAGNQPEARAIFNEKLVNEEEERERASLYRRT